MNYKELFEDTLSEICEKAPFSDDEELFGIVKERTGYMRKKKIRMKKPVVIAAAATAAAALTVSVGALVNYYHQRSVDTFIQGASETESAVMIDETSPLTSANEHFRITLDRSYYDGENLTCILTVESLDGTEIPGLKVFGCQDEDFRGGKAFMLHCYMSTRYRWDDTDHTKKIAYVAHISGTEIRKYLYVPLKEDEGLAGGTYFRFNINDYPLPQLFVRTEDGKYTEAVPEREWNAFYDIRLYANIEKNVETAELFNEHGDKLIMSEIGYYSNEVNAYPVFGDGITDPAEQNVALVLNDGTIKAFDKFLSDAYYVGTSCYVLFPEMIQLGDYSGVEVNGVRYLKR